MGNGRALFLASSGVRIGGALKLNDMLRCYFIGCNGVSRKIRWE